MTTAEASKELKGFGIELTKTDRYGFRINFEGGAERTAYYANSLDEAVGVGRLMSEYQMKIKRCTWIRMVKPKAK